MIVLDDWQQEILDYDGNILLAKGRRIGATQIMARKAVDYLMTHKQTHPLSQIVCVSLTEDQAKLIIAFAKQYAEERYWRNIGKGDHKPTQQSLTMMVDKNARTLLSRPVGNTGSGSRGFEGEVLMVDEAPFMPELFWIAAKPILMTKGGKIWMWGTFNGKQGYFWDRFHDVVNLKKESRFRAWMKTTEDVLYKRPISESWPEEQAKAAIQLFEEERKEMPAKFFGQEYMCIPLDELRQFFEEELIDDTLTLTNEGKRGQRFFLGVDIARMGDDESTFEILADVNGVFHHIESIVTKKTLTTETEARILQLDKIYNFEKIGIDAGSGSLGVGIYDHLMQNGDMRYKLVAMNNRALSLNRDGKEKQRMQKEDFYDNLKAMMQHKQIKLLNDDKVRLSLKSVQWEFTKDEDSSSRIRIFGSYTHIAEGLIRAAWLARQAKPIFSGISWM